MPDDSFEDATLPLSGEPWSPEALDDVPKQFGHYERLELVGRGGMGSVYRAYDTRLQRTVALKFINAGSPEMKARLVFEARAQARIDDTRVCRVYDVDQIDGRPYVAMQFIHGRTLSEAAPGMTLDEKVQVMVEVAEGVHSAHRVGLVHRDLKTSNIMVERTEGGEWQPYVLDFGLAREVAAPGLSSTGVLVGTPWFMSPEQARGDRGAIDRRTDVYGLGVTLYEIISGALPFVGETSMEVLLNILNEEPIRLREQVRWIPADLETIVMKCLEKDPSRRYESAHALAEDLRHLLEGEPITAKPTSRFSRAVRVTWKHRALVTVAAIAGLLVLIAAAVAIRERVLARERSATAQRLGREITTVESMMRFGEMLPMHDLRREKAMVRTRIHAIGAGLTRMSKTEGAPAQYAVGRGLLALDEIDPARTHLETAWRDGFRDPAVAYALGLAFGRVYERELTQVNLLRGESRKVRLKEIETLYRDPAVRYLRAARGASAETPAYGEALVQHYENHHDDALRRAEEALRAIPWLHEAQRLQGDVHAKLAIAASDRGEYDVARREFERADDEYRRAVALAQSDPISHERRADVWLKVMWMQLYGPGGDLEAPLQKVLESASAASAIDPSRSRPQVMAAQAWRMLAEQQENAGEDPRAAHARSREAATRATRIDPNDASAFSVRGVGWRTEASYLRAHGSDPEAGFESAIRDLEVARRLRPDDPVIENHLGNSWLLLGEWNDDRGQDPFAPLRKAVTHFENAIRVSPRYTPAYTNIGLAHTRIAEFQERRGISSLDALAASIQAYRQAVTINPEFLVAWNNLGLTQYEEGKAMAHRGGDPRPVWKNALESFGRATRINPSYPLPYFNRSLIHSELAEQEYFAGRDPAAEVARAEKEFADGLKVNPDIALSYLFVTTARMNEAKYRIEHGQNGDTALARSKELLDRAGQIDARQPLVDELAIEWNLTRADADRLAGRSPERSFAAAIAAAERAFAARSESSTGLVSSARAYRARAAWRQERGVAADGDLHLAQERIDAALRVNARDASAHLTRARILAIRGQKDEARQALARAEQLNPGVKQQSEYRAALAEIAKG